MKTQQLAKKKEKTRILEWVATPSSSLPSQPKDQTRVSYGSLHWQMGALPTGATKEAQPKKLNEPQVEERKITSRYIIIRKLSAKKMMLLNCGVACKSRADSCQCMAKTTTIL